MRSILTKIHNLIADLWRAGEWINAGAFLIFWASIGLPCLIALIGILIVQGR